jgi:hypothetical protein
MNLQNNKFLFLAGIGSMCVALLHAVIIYIGPAAYRYFEAGEDMARMAEEESWLPPAMTLGIICVFFVFALYAFSGCNRFKSLPYLKPALFLIGTIYSLRGLATFYFIYLLLNTPGPDLVKNLVFSLVSLTIGILYLSGWFLTKKR